jgi:hypothetical protein
MWALEGHPFCEHDVAAFPRPTRHTAYQESAPLFGFCCRLVFACVGAMEVVCIPLASRFLFPFHALTSVENRFSPPSIARHAAACPHVEAVYASRSLSRRQTAIGMLVGSKRRLRQSKQKADALEHFWTLGEQPTVESSQQTVMAASYPHCSQDFRIIHTPLFQIQRFKAGSKSSMIRRIRIFNKHRLAESRQSAFGVRRESAN